jgi:2-haloacid dehalogenase
MNPPDRATKLTRRTFLSAGAASVAGATLGVALPAEATRPAAGDRPGRAFEDVGALTFDVFGTVVDWRGSIIREGRLLSATRGYAVDWEAFADRWRGGYGPAMNQVRRGELPWTRLDDLHRRILDELLPEFGLGGMTEQEIDHLNRAWHRLMPWPDSVGGLNRLRSRFILATLSNGNVSLLTNMAKNAGLPWDCILSAELMRHYKPDPAVYLGAADLLGLPPERVMMVAAHKSDLRAAKAQGLRTAFVARPLEWGGTREVDVEPDPEFDVSATDFYDLAERLGV